MTNPKYPYQRTLYITLEMSVAVAKAAKAKGITQADYYRQAVQAALDNDKVLVSTIDREGNLPTVTIEMNIGD